MLHVSAIKEGVKILFKSQAELERKELYPDLSSPVRLKAFEVRGPSHTF